MLVCPLPPIYLFVNLSAISRTCKSFLWRKLVHGKTFFIYLALVVWRGFLISQHLSLYKILVMYQKNKSFQVSRIIHFCINSLSMHVTQQKTTFMENKIKVEKGKQYFFRDENRNEKFSVQTTLPRDASKEIKKKIIYKFFCVFILFFHTCKKEN